jgi:hypothetical protein
VVDRTQLAKATLILDWVFYFFIASFFVSLSGTMILISFPKILMGSGDGDHINYGRNFFELVYFFTNSMVAVIAVLAIRFAQRQVIIASIQTETSIKIAQSEVYLRLVDRIGSLDMEAGVYFQEKLVDEHRSANSTEDLPTYAHNKINNFTDADRKKLMGFLTLLEDIGLMARRGYLSMDDIYFLLEGDLKDFGDVYLEYLEYRRTNSYNQRMCEHAIWLLKTIRTYVPTVELPPEPG